MEEAAAAGNVRRSRFWLYTPFVLLLLVALAWSAAWFVMRERAGEALDGWLAAEAREGREWTCADRRIGGYPFRLEIVCNALDLKRGAVNASFGRAEAVAQVYQPRRLIAAVEGPLRLTDGAVTVQGTWDLLQSSINTSQKGLRRLSLVAEAPRITVAGLGSDEIATAGRRFELHLRPNPSRATEQAYDAAISIDGARIPALDDLIGGSEPADLEADVTVTEAGDFRGGPIVEELERWRRAGGEIDILMLSLVQGPRRLEAKGELRLDDEHRPMGQLNMAASGIGGVIGKAVGGGTGGALLGALLGGQPPRAAAGRGDARPALTPLPPLRLANGSLAMGPFVIPNVRLQPLY